MEEEDLVEEVKNLQDEGKEALREEKSTEDSESDCDDFPEMCFEGENGLVSYDEINVPSKDTKFVELKGTFKRRVAEETKNEARRHLFICIDNSPFSLSCLEWCAKSFLPSDMVTLVHAETWNPMRIEILPMLKLKCSQSNANLYKTAYSKANRFMQVASVKCATFGRTAGDTGGSNSQRNDDVTTENKFRVLLVNHKQESVKSVLHRMIEKERPSLVIVGSRGWVNRVVLGSVSDYLAHHATVPVLIYKQSLLDESDESMPKRSNKASHA